MEKKIITISREFGSGGRTIGRLIAEKLNIPPAAVSSPMPLRLRVFPVL